MSRALYSCSLLSLAALAASCAHELSLVNMKDYKVDPSEGKRRAIAVRTVQGDADAVEYGRHVTEALRRHPSVRLLKAHWKDGAAEQDFSPDVVVEIRPRAEYSGSGWNFPLTFPGFLFFLPAGHGYVYHASVTTEIDLFERGGSAPSRTVSVPTNFAMRHCDFGRAFFAQSGWWVPGYGASSLLSAPYMISYDTDATEPFHEKVERVYGDYVAEQIIRALNGTLEDERVAVTGVIPE